MEDIKYPLNLSDNAFVKLTAINWNRTLLVQGEPRTLKDAWFSCILPIPQSGLTMTDQHELAEFSGLTDAYSRFTSLAAEGIMAMADSYSLGGILTSEQFFNERLVSQYAGVNLRTFPFEWDFIPESTGDSKQLEIIINNIRRYGMPNYGNDDSIIDFPCAWLIQPVVDGKLVMEFDHMIIEDMVINNDQNGQTMFFTDGKPVKTNLRIQFREVRQSGKERLNWDEVK